jgi:hypothetical protein
MTVKLRLPGIIAGRICSSVALLVVPMSLFLPQRAHGSEESVLVGVVTRAEVEQAMPDWVGEAMRVEPDLEATERLVREIVGAEVRIYLGTWCDDTRRELGRLWWALDSLGVGEMPELGYLAVDRGLAEPADALMGVDLIRVPTFVVRRDGRELGRIVEESPNGIENDLLALLTGDSTGTLTASEDLLGEEADPRP